MKRIVITRRGGPEVLQVQESPDPKPRAGEVLIRVNIVKPSIALTTKLLAYRKLAGISKWIFSSQDHHKSL